MLRTAECVCCTKCSRIGSASREVKETGGKGVGDGQCNRNEEKEQSEEKVGRNASMIHQLLDVA
jgi:hypothetical protein